MTLRTALLTLDPDRLIDTYGWGTHPIGQFIRGCHAAIMDDPTRVEERANGLHTLVIDRGTHTEHWQERCQYTHYHNHEHGTCSIPGRPT